MGGGWEGLWKGAVYIWAFFRWAGPWGFLWILVPIGFISLWKENRGAAVIFGFALSAQLFFIVVAGGDWMKPFRFFVPIIPILLLLLVEGYRFIAARWWSSNRVGEFVGALILLILILCVNLYPSKEVQWYTKGYTKGMNQTSVSWGKWLAGQASREDWIVLGDVGAIPYYSGLRVIDLYGLVNPSIAKLPGPALYSEGIDTAGIRLRPQRRRAGVCSRL